MARIEINMAALGGAMAAGAFARTPIEREADRIFNRSIKQLTRRLAVEFYEPSAEFQESDPTRKQMGLRELRWQIRQELEPYRDQTSVIQSTKSNYSKARTKAALSALVELGQELEPYRDDIVLIGGLATYLLTKGFFDHCGSNDIDFAVKTPTRPKDKTIREIITSLGYEIVTTPPRGKGLTAGPKNPWRFSKTDDKGYSIILNFVGEWPGILPASETYLSVQDGLNAEPFRDIDIAFIFNHEKDIGLSNNRTERTTFRVVDLAGLLALKITEGRIKDYYNIFALTHCNGGPLQAAESFKQQVSGKRVPKQHLERLKTTTRLISCEFKSEWSDGARSVEEFDKKQKADVVARQVTQFIESASQVRDYETNCQTCHLFDHSTAECLVP